MLICLTALVILIIGQGKQTEPKYSLMLSPALMRYQHRYSVWQAIHRLDILRGHCQLQHTEMPYIGIKLKDFDKFAAHISPRLANRLIHEQKQPSEAHHYSSVLVCLHRRQF